MLQVSIATKFQLIVLGHKKAFQLICPSIKSRFISWMWTLQLVTPYHNSPNHKCQHHLWQCHWFTLLVPAMLLVHSGVINTSITPVFSTSEVHRVLSKVSKFAKLGDDHLTKLSLLANQRGCHAVCPWWLLRTLSGTLCTHSLVCSSTGTPRAPPRVDLRKLIYLCAMRPWLLIC